MPILIAPADELSFNAPTESNVVPPALAIIDIADPSVPFVFFIISVSSVPPFVVILIAEALFADVDRVIKF